MTFSTLKPSTKPMKRTAFKRAATGLTGALSSESRQMAKLAKPTRCKVCRTEYDRQRPGQKVCGPDCAAVLVMSDRAKAERKAAKIERANDRKRKEEIKTIPQLKAEAQKAFNVFIRERDRQAGHPCISSGRPLSWLDLGGGVDAGHYRSVGSADHLRFDERNCHAQSKQDNRYGSGCATDYRIGLIERIGLGAVEALEADQTIVKWTREALIAIKWKYRAKLKALQGAS